MKGINLIRRSLGVSLWYSLPWLLESSSVWKFCLSRLAFLALWFWILLGILLKNIWNKSNGSISSSSYWRFLCCCSACLSLISSSEPNLSYISLFSGSIKVWKEWEIFFIFITNNTFLNVSSADFDWFLSGWNLIANFRF